LSQTRRSLCSKGLHPWALTALVTAFTLAIYVRTMAPTITLLHDGADSGDLVTAAINLGVPHPTGYPLYTMLAHLFTLLPGPEPAWNVNLLSTLAAALAVGIVFWVSYRSVARQEGCDVLALAAASTAAGLYGFGQLLWSQATIAEVYSLHALLVALVLLAVNSAPLSIRPYAVAFLFGLGLSNHVTIVFMLPALWPYAAAIRSWLSARRLLLVAACVLPGLATYLYIPIRAVQNPVPNWGLADNLPRLWWLVGAAAYRNYLLPMGLWQWLHRLAAWVGIWARDLGPVGLGLALLGLWEGWGTRRRSVMAEVTYVALLSLYSMAYSTADSYIYLIPVSMIMAVWTAHGAAAILHSVRGATLVPGRASLLATVATLVFIALPIVALISRFSAMDLHTDREAYRFAQQVLEAADPGGLVISEGDAQTFPLWYLRYGLKLRPDVTIVDRRLLAFGWYRSDIVAREPDLSALASGSDAWSAVTILVQEIGQRRPVHLTFSDKYVLQLANWEHEPPLYTLRRE
jgi:hypothetical protein